MKRQLAIILVFAMLAGVIAGCTSNTSNKQPATSETDQSTSVTESKNPLDKPGSLSFLVIQQAGAPLSESMSVMKELSERTNTKLQFTNVPQADLPTRIQTLAAAKQLPDVIENGGSDRMNFLDSGIFHYLEDYISKETTPNIWDAFEKYPAYKKDISTDEGRIMGIAQLTTRFWRCDWIINNTFLTELGMSAPTNIDEFYNYLVAVKEKYPNSTPLGVGPWAGGHNAVKQPIMYMFNVTNEWWLYNDGEFLYGPWEKQEEYADALRFLNKLYVEGLVDPEFFSISAEETNAKISNNEVGILYGWDDGYGQWGKNGTWGIDMIPCPPIKGPDGVAYTRGNPRNMGALFLITNSCKDVPRAVAFFDYCFSEEATELLNWGIEGTHWMMLNGERAYTDLITKHDQGYVIGRYAQGLAHPRFPQYIDGDVELILNGPETAQHVEYLKNSTMFPSIPSLTATKEEDEFKKIYTDISALYKEYESKLITGSPADFDKTFEEYMTKIKEAGIERACEIRSTQYERYKKR
jgi:putative aldouronate transport system substrate-binding protein